MLKGKAWKYGDDVDTDVIIPARYLTTADPDVLKTHCMEDIDPGFAGKVTPGDMIVAGNNFGCGSSREHAPVSIKAAGISCIIAKSFGRIFFRNSFNIGLPILESAEAAAAIETGDEIEVDLAAGLIRNLTRAAEYRAQPVPDFMRELVADGGLMEHVKKLLAEGKIGKSAEEEKVEEPEEKKEPGSRMLELEQEKQAGGRDAPWVEDTELRESEPKAIEELDEEGEQEEAEESDEERSEDVNTEESEE